MDNKDMITSYIEMNDIPLMLTVEEMGRLLRISRNTAYAFAKSGEIPTIKVGKQIRIYRGDVMNYMMGLASA